MTQAVFFDLDGTLLDTAQDFAYAINLLLAERNQPSVDFQAFRKEVYGESKRMISYAFSLTETDPQFEIIRQQFLQTYHHNCTQKTVFFDGIPELLDTLDARNIPWGIITNKPTWLATPIVKHFELDKRATCIVTGDMLAKTKPDPLPLFYACEKTNMKPENAVYVGDLEGDIIAAKAAGMKSIGVTYGYHPPNTNFSDWNTDYTAECVGDILRGIDNLCSQKV